MGARAVGPTPAHPRVAFGRSQEVGVGYSPDDPDGRQVVT